MEDSITTAYKADTRRVLTGFADEWIEEELTVGYDDQKKGIKTSIRNIVEGDRLLELVRFEKH